MPSYIKYKEYYDRKAKAAPLKERGYCFVLEPKAGHQGSKIPFRDYRWVGRFIIQKVLPNEKNIVRRTIIKSLILHRIRLKNFVPSQPQWKIFEKSDYSRTKKLSFRKTICTQLRGRQTSVNS